PQEVQSPDVVCSSAVVLYVDNYAGWALYALLAPGAHDHRSDISVPEPLGRTEPGKPDRDLFGVCFLAIFPWQRVAMGHSRGRSLDGGLVSHRIVGAMHGC